MNRRTYELTLTSVLLGLVILLAAVPSLGYIQLPFFPVSITIIHIPVLIAGVFGSRKMTIYLGLAFGLSSLAVALTRSSMFLDPLFTSPLVSVLPRLILGLILIDLLKLTNITKRLEKTKLLSLALYFFIATIIHSVLVLAAMYYTAKTGWYIDILGTKDIISEWILTETAPIKFVYGIVISNGLFEAIFATVIGVPIAKALQVSVGRLK